MGEWGERMREEKKKQRKERGKNRLEKTYTLYFNKTEYVLNEDYRLEEGRGEKEGREGGRREGRSERRGV